MAAVDEQSLTYQDTSQGLFFNFVGRRILCSDVVHMLGLSVRTTGRRLQELNISSAQFFIIIHQTFDDFDCTIENILRSFLESRDSACRKRDTYRTPQWTKVVEIMYQSNRSFNIPPRAFEFLENFCSNTHSPGRKAVQMPPPPRNFQITVLTFQHLLYYASEAMYVNMVYQTTPLHATRF